MFEYEQFLSPAGARRRDEILRVAQHAARSRRHKRYFVRGASAVACAIAITLLLHRSNVVPPQSPIVELPQKTSISTIVIDRIDTDPTIADRLSVRPRAANWQQIGDDELLQSLAKAGQPAGLIHVDGNTILVTDSDSQQ